MRIDGKDLFIICLITAGWLASTVFLFLHPAEGNFATWGVWSAAVTAAYRWIDYKDSKVPDAG